VGQGGDAQADAGADKQQRRRGAATAVRQREVITRCDRDQRDRERDIGRLQPVTPGVEQVEAQRRILPVQVVAQALHRDGGGDEYPDTAERDRAERAYVGAMS